MELPIQLSGEINHPNIILAGGAYKSKDLALKSAKEIRDITDFKSLEAAANVLIHIKGLVKSIEDSRKLVKEPILNAGRRIDAIAKTFCGELEVEAGRLSLIVGAYQDAERKKTERIRQEAIEKEQQALAEMNAREVARIHQGGEREKIEEDLDAIRGETADKIATAQIELANAIGPKPDGLAARKNWKFEVTDIKALFKAHPELCLISPNNVAIRVFIKTNQNIPGLRIWRETVAVVRSTAPMLSTSDY